MSGIILTGFMIGLVLQDSMPPRVTSVPVVDLQRYAGVWHEVAKFPNRFQQKCREETTATYAPLPAGDLRVVNTCRGDDGTALRVEGRARLADRNGPTPRLKVRFAPAFLSFLSAVWGDYWLVSTSPPTTAYAVVGEPKRRYLWILSRTPQMPEPLYAEILLTPKGPGIEFLEYITPRDGRPYPEDSILNDLWHWQVTLRVEDAAGFFSRLMSTRTRFISPEFVDIQALGLGGRKAALIRDPVFHALRLVAQ